MYHITYKNTLRSEKNRNDFMRWLKVHWPLQQSWGATSVKLWNSDEGDKKIVFCRYTVENINMWNQMATGPDAETLVQALDEVVDISQMGVKVTIPTSLNN